MMSLSSVQHRPELFGAIDEGESLTDRFVELGIGFAELDASLVVSYDHQVGGHRTGDGNASSRDVQRFRHSDGSLHILKPLQHDERGVREAYFYHRISEKFARLIPKFYGLFRTPSNHFSVCLEDCTAGLSFPCVADIKIGRVTYDLLATPEKIQKEIKNYKWQSEIGFRFVGIKSYSQQTQAFTVYGKPFGKGIEPETVHVAWSTLLNCGHPTNVKIYIIDELLRRLREIAEFVRQQEEFLLFSSSLLLAFEGGVIKDEMPKVSINMIDFGHAFPIRESGERDHNYKFGIDRLINSLEDYQKKHC